MFVTNHALAGVIIGRAMPRRPFSAFVIGVGSHLLLDTIPHWGCDMNGTESSDRFLQVARRDGLLGLATFAVMTLVTERQFRAATLAAMAGSVLLDLDKPFDHFFGVNPFPERVGQLHRWVQREVPGGLRLELVYGSVFAALDLMSIRHGRMSAETP
jgi:hypothetical protein